MRAWARAARAAAGVLVMSTMGAEAQSARHRELVRYDDVSLVVVAEGQGPLVVLLPSRGRDSEDYDDVAAGIARAGYRVLRPQPRGVAGSTGPMDGITLHDLAKDIAVVIDREGGGAPAVVVGHAFGNWVARMTAVDHPKLVRGVVIVAAAAKKYPPELSAAVSKAGDPALSDQERLKYLRDAFFAPGHDPTVWLKGWYPEANASQDGAAKATKQSEWWPAGTAPLFDLQAADDPFKPVAARGELKEEFGDRVTIAVIPNASHALIPEQPQAVVDAIVGWMRTLP